MLTGAAMPDAMPISRRGFKGAGAPDRCSRVYQTACLPAFETVTTSPDEELQAKAAARHASRSGDAVIAFLLLAQGVMVFTCADPKGQSELNRCAFEDYHRADAALNAQWKRTIAYQRKLDVANFTDQDGMPTWVDALTRSQRAWVSFRDAQCNWEGLDMRGSARTELEGECLARKTLERTAYLKTLGD